MDLSEKDETFPYKPFVALLDKAQDIHLLAAKNLVILSSLKKAPSQYVLELFTFISTQLATPTDPNLQEIAVLSFGLLLQPKWYRELFWTKSAEFVPPLVRILTTSRTNLQLQYHTLLVFWLLSFETVPAKEMVTKFDFVPIYFDIIKNSVKEKIIRLAVALLVNISCPQSLALSTSQANSDKKPELTNQQKQQRRVAINSLLLNDGINMISTLCERKWADEELVADLTTLKQNLQEAFDSMTTFDEYKNELESKKLRWSPPHKSEGFWKENAEEFKAHDWKVLKALVDIIKSKPDDSTVNAVAASDINHIFSLFPEAVKVVERIGGKVCIMELMADPSEEVRYEALKATQTLISNTL